MSYCHSDVSALCWTQDTCVHRTLTCSSCIIHRIASFMCVPYLPTNLSIPSADTMFPSLWRRYPPASAPELVELEHLPWWVAVVGPNPHPKLTLVSAVGPNSNTTLPLLLLLLFAPHHNRPVATCDGDKAHTWTHRLHSTGTVEAWTAGLTSLEQFRSLSRPPRRRLGHQCTQQHKHRCKLLRLARIIGCVILCFCSWIVSCWLMDIMIL